MLSNSKFFVTIAMRASKSGGMRGLLNLLLVVAFVQHVNGLAQLQQKQQQSEHEHFERAISDGIGNQYNNNNNNNNNIKFNDDIRKHTLTSTTPLARLHKFSDKEIDLDAYVNEFNMQDEAAIPEDILDQKHIDDKDNEELDQTADFNSDMTMGSTSLRMNFEGSHFKQVNENERQKYAKNPTVENVRSIGPMTFMASSSSSSRGSKSNSNSNIQHKQIHDEMWHVADKERDLSKDNNKNNYNKPIKVDNNNNYMNLYNKNKKSGIKEMQLERTAIGDIENVACNEDESLANTNSNMKGFKSKQQGFDNDEDEENDDDDEEDAEELSENVIDRDKSVHNIRTGQTFAHQDNAAKVQTHTAWSQAGRQQEAAQVSKIANGQSALQMAANVNRSRKQRRNLPEMKFGHRRDGLDLYGRNADEDVDDASVGVGVGVGNADNDEYTIKTANALSSPAIAGTPEEINDYKNDYLNIFSIRNNTSTPNVRLPLGQVQNKVLNGTSADRVAIDETNKATDDANPSSIVSSSTFEQYKSKQRNNGHTGHKTHKKKYKDYLRYTWSILQTTPTETFTERATIISNKYNDNNSNNNNNMQVDGFDKINATIKAQSLSRQHERAQKLQTEKSRGFPVPPIFTITSNPEGNMAILKRHNSTTNRPFYEGQINYYLETKDDNDENVEQQAYVNDSKSVGGSGTGTDWYRRNSPMLRNGLRRTETNNNINHMHQNTHNPRQQHYQHKFHEHPASNRYHHKLQQIPHQHTHHFSHALHQRHHHHHHQQQHHQQYQHNPHHHQHQNHHDDQSQRKTTYTGGSSVLGHQITDAEDFERYYAKWPHLARVQFQVYDEHLREANEQHAEKDSQEDEYPEYEYGSVAEMEEAQKVKPDEDNLPPYVRKYNRRNKQLLDLLEGPLPPPKGYHWSGSKLQPGPVESSDNAQVIRLDDDYMREKRRRHQLFNGSKNNQLNDNFFAQQRQNDTTTNTATVKNISELYMNNNHLPDEQQQQRDQMEMASELKTHVNKLIGNEPQMTWQIEKLLMPTTTTTTTTQTPKALVFRLPSFSSNQVGHAALRQRSRSAYTAGSTGQRRYMSGLLDSMELHETESSSNNNNVPAMRLEKEQQQTTTTTLAYPSTSFGYVSTVKPLAIGTKMPKMPPRSISAFVYHRVVDNSPRQVGAGGTLQGRKQQLPFVAITDRRLETFKKSLLERQKEFEQNNFPPLP